MTLMNITFKIESGVYSRCDVQNLYCFFYRIATFTISISRYTGVSIIVV